MSELGTGEVMALLRAQYPSERGWAFFEEARNSPGFPRQVRSADGIALGLWPSLGLELLGFEVKVSRSDWRRELKDPSKAGEFQKWCDRWWVVAPAGIVERAELPPTWGLLEVPEKGRKRLVVSVPAPKLEAQPLDRRFVAALVRQVQTDLEGKVRAEADKRWMANRAAEVERQEADRAELVRQKEAAEEKLRELVHALGLSVYDVKWSGLQVVNQVKAALAARRVMDQQAFALERAAQALENLTAGRAELAALARALREAAGPMPAAQEVGGAG